VSTELRGSKTLAAIKDVRSLAGQVVNLEKALGNKRIELPQGPEDKDRLDAYFRAAGWPEKAEDYSVNFDGLEFPDELKTPEALKQREAETAFLQTVAHEARLTAPQLQLLARKFAEHELQQYQQNQGAQAEAVEKAQTALKNKLGPNYDKAVQLAHTAETAFLDETQLAHAQAMGWTNDPVWIEMMHKVGTSIAPDRLNARTDGAVDKASVQRQIDELMASPAYSDPKSPGHNQVVERVHQLFEQKHAAG
jgi:hypothetical protein